MRCFFIIEKQYITNESFFNYITNDDEYIDNQEIVSDALYVSPSGDGEGKSISDPCSIYDAVDNVKAGQTIYLRGGNYDLEGTVYINKSGSINKFILRKSSQKADNVFNNLLFFLSLYLLLF